MIIDHPHSKSVPRGARHEAQWYESTVDGLHHDSLDIIDVYGYSEGKHALGEAEQHGAGEAL